MRQVRFQIWSLSLSLFVLPVDFAHAKAQCRDVNAIIKSVADEPCEAVLEEAESCFGKLNERYVDLKNFPAKSRKDRLGKIKILTGDYESAVKTMKTYHEYLRTAGDNACVDQSGSMEVWLEETESDLTDLKKPGF